MKKATVVLVMAVVLAALAFGGIAAADTIAGEGTIRAEGYGVAIVSGTGTVDIVGNGLGYVFVRNASTLDVTGHGRRVDYRDGVLLAGWSGRIHVEGEGLYVRMRGGYIEFTATGEGWVFLEGRGSYTLNGAAGHWQPVGRRYLLTANDTLS